MRTLNIRVNGLWMHVPCIDSQQAVRLLLALHRVGLCVDQWGWTPQAVRACDAFPHSPAPCGVVQP